MFAAILLLAPHAFAADPPNPAGEGKPPAEKAAPTVEKVKPEVEVSGIAFAHYGFDLTEGAENFNEFAVDRVYFNVKAKLSKRLSTRFTLDVDRMKPVETDTGEFEYDTKYRAFLKYAFLEWKDFAPGLKVRVGMIDTPYVTVWETHTEMRYIGKHFADELKLLDTADIGISIAGEHGKGLVAWTAAVVNGEGYGKIELDNAKSLQARVTVDPIAPAGKYTLPITAFVNYNMQQDADPIVTYVGAAGFKMPYVWVWGEYLGRSQGDLSGMGYSASVQPGMPKYGRLVFKYDHFDPDTKTDEDAIDKIIGGVSHDFAEKVALAATYERVTVEGTADVPAHGVYLRLMAGF